MADIVGHGNPRTEISGVKQAAYREGDPPERRSSDRIMTTLRPRPFYSSPIVIALKMPS